MQWTGNVGVGKVCCLQTVINIDEPPKSEGGNTWTVKINGETLTKS